MQRYQNYIGGEWIDPAGATWLETSNPYTGAAWAEIPRSDPSDVDRAVSAALAASRGEWGSLRPSRRGQLLLRLADLIEANATHLAEIEVRDNGKLYAEMLLQTTYTAGWYRYYGGMADKVEGAVIPTDKTNIFNFTRYEPLGVVGMITPWNSPLLLLAWKLAAALAAGNTAVIKPSEFTSASALEFMPLFEQAGFPPGVVNTVTGFGADVGAALVAHPDVAKIAFTGSDTAGQKVYESAARTFKHVSLELGGKSPNIVFEDADLEAAVMGAISGIFAASGQTCLAGSRLLLQRSIHDRFVERLVEVAGSARIGDPMLPETHVGPITTEPQYRKVLECIATARREGATCVLGGGAYTGPGAQGGQFVQPTIFVGVSNDMSIAQNEVFGPVLASFRSTTRTRRSGSPMMCATASLPESGPGISAASCACRNSSALALSGSIPTAPSASPRPSAATSGAGSAERVASMPSRNTCRSSRSGSPPSPVSPTRSSSDRPRLRSGLDRACAECTSRDGADAGPASAMRSSPRTAAGLPP